MTAKTKDGKEIFSDYRIYMPQAPAYGMGDRMVYGPYKKSGLLRDTSLQPGQTKIETFEIKFPYEDRENDGKKVREVKAKEMDVTVKLWYLPAGGDYKKGVIGKDQFIFYEGTETVAVR